VTHQRRERAGSDRKEQEPGVEISTNKRREEFGQHLRRGRSCGTGLGVDRLMDVGVYKQKMVTHLLQGKIL
jgi:hypothetical protein